MKVTMCYDTSEQTYCRPLCINSVGYHFKHCDCLKTDSHYASRFRSVTVLRSVRMVCAHTVRRVQSPSRTARDKRSAIISIKYAAIFRFLKDN